MLLEIKDGDLPAPSKRKLTDDEARVVPLVVARPVGYCGIGRKSTRRKRAVYIAAGVMERSRAEVKVLHRQGVLL